MIISFQKYWKICVIFFSIFLEKTPKSTHFRWWSEILFSNLAFFHQTLNLIFQNNLISAEILKMCWKSPKWRKNEKWFQKSLISAVILKLSWKSRLSTKSQRKCDYFRLQIQKIVCHDPQIRSIFSLFKKSLKSTNFYPQTPKFEEMTGWEGKRGDSVLKSSSFQPFQSCIHARAFNTLKKFS